MTQIILPELGEGITKATIVCWHKNIGDSIKQGEDLLEVVTDKAVFNVEAPVSGTLASISVNEGKEGVVGAVLGTIDGI